MAALSLGGGLPLGVVLTTIPTWLADQGVGPAAVGALSAVGLPWSLKFAWSPILDRYGLGPLGRRRGWMLVGQIVMVGALLALAGADPHALALVAALATLLVVGSATQDIAMDGYALELMRPEERGPGNSLRTVFYRVGMLLASGVAVAAADVLPWPVVFGALAGVLVLASLATLTAPPTPHAEAHARTLGEAVVGPFRAFVAQRDAAWIAAFIVLYKLGDNMTLSMASVFFRQALQVSLTEMGFLQKTVGLVATIAGTLLGGALLPRLGLRRCLIAFGVAQAAMSLLFSATAATEGWRPMMYAAITLENLAAGMATAALLTFMMGVVEPRYAATQLALLTSLMALGRSFAGLPSGRLVDAIGYAAFFAVSALVALPGLVLAVRLARDAGPSTDGAPTSS
jgi:PAT family beta-lactamase induction signal transducer AmpG